MGMVGNLQEAHAKENDELDLLCRGHLQLDDDGNGKGKQNDLCDDLVEDGEFQDGQPIEALCCLGSFEVPLSSDGVASDGCREEEGDDEENCECHEGKDAPLEPHVRKDTQI